MKTIWKYPLSRYNILTQVRMPYNAKILCVQIQNSIPTLWVLVDLDAEVNELRNIVIYGTNWDIPDEVEKYIGTYQNEEFVWHVFEQ